MSELRPDLAAIAAMIRPVPGCWMSAAVTARSWSI